ncbi:hypothetical protein B1756_09585 [Natrarchaeobaculum aegyptiacum]|uniref:DUF58 domain-containing protein n=2 Tax=Natrarchaeobaculum aegyptiacum TaxID=745377 RepID=A0A2Z2I086_9EURY|nr:hypothetical protein B1756_09585 [Natrarchaeobaculum aegyptiacum]
MDFTTKTRTHGSIAVVLTGYAVLTQDVLALVGAGLVGGWLLGRQVAFTRDLQSVTETLSIDQRAVRDAVRTDDVTPVGLHARLDHPTPLSVTVTAGVPRQATIEPGETTPMVTLEPGAVAADDHEDVRWPISGRHEFDPVTVTAATDGFRETLTLDVQATITVEPRESEPVHVGRGGERIGTAYGDHDGGRLGSGDEPAEAREYVPGDTADRIDWKATARFGTAYVREYDTQINRETTLLIDNRSTLADGPTGATKFDHLREVALSMAERAIDRGDPVGLVTVDDDGIETHLEHATGGSGHRTIRRRLLDLRPSDGSRATERHLTGDAARSHLTSITGSDDDPFADTLRPFFEARAGGAEHVAVESLRDGLKATLTNQQRRRRTVIFTDDERPGDLRETIALARARGNEVVVVIAASVLYETDNLTELESAFDRYVAFEQVRRDLSRLDGVTALEVGPGDRLSTVLGAGRQGHRQRRRDERSSRARAPATGGEPR